MANFKNTIYLLSFDDELVASALDSTYPKGGYDYLEKIIQLPLRLPKAQFSAIRNYTLTSLFQVLNAHEVLFSEEELERFIAAFDKHYLRLINTPRIATRFANSISFSIPLLKDEVNIVDLVMIEGVKVTFPDLYSFIRSNPSLFARNYGANSRYDRDYKEIENTKVLIDDFLGENYPNKIDKLKEMVKEIFPQLEAVFGNESFSNDTWREWYEKKRICSGRYFERYFSYVVIEGEISDVLFDDLINRLTKEDFLDHTEELKKKLMALDGGEVALKFQFLEDSFTSNQKEKLSLNLCLVGDCFPAMDSAGYRIMAPFQQMAYFIQNCVKAQIEGQNEKLPVKLMERALPLDFAFEIWRTLHPRRNGGNEIGILSEGGFKAASKALYVRCKREFTLNQLFESIEDSYFRYFLEIGSELQQEEVKQEVKEWLQSDSSNFLKLLYAFSQTTYSQSYSNKKLTANAYKSNFSKAFYDKLKETVNIDFFYSLSLELFGDQSDFQPTSDRDELSDNQLVGWFQRIHMKKNLKELNSDDIPVED